MAKNLKTIQGRALWAKVFEPDTKFDADGIYSLNLLIPESESHEIGEYLETLRDEHMANEIKRNPKLTGKLSTKPVFEEYYDKDGNKTGDMELKLKQKAKLKLRDGSISQTKILVVDAKRNPMNGDVLIGNGSIVKAAFEPVPYLMQSTKQCGVSLRLKGVQVIELAEYGGAGASMFDEEDGFVQQRVEKDNSVAMFDDGMTNESTEGDF
jgi:hypothetical protein